MTVIETISNLVSPIYDVLWAIAFVVLIGSGLYFTFRLKGVQLVRFGRSMRLTFERERHKDGRTVSAFQAFCIGMGTRIGVGNIAGVATAIMTGGPGAIFWMWVFALVGAATSFMESTLSQIYKERKEDGGFFGGPAYYASKGTGNRRLGIAVAVVLTLTLGFGFIAVEASVSASALSSAFPFEGNTWVFAIVIALLATVLITGGVRRIARFSTVIVPLMAVSWIVFAGVLICLNIGNVPAAFGMIFEQAFAPSSIVGGGIGTAISIGLQRGIFSNDSGLGTVSNVAAVADIKHPIKQGFIQSFGVLVDTLLICTVTALVILSYGSFESIYWGFGDMVDGSWNPHDGSVLVQDVAAATIGGAANVIIALFMLVFSFTSLVGDYVSSESNLRFIRDDRRIVTFLRMGIIAIAAVSAVLDTEFIDLICFTFIAVMAILNVAIIMRLRNDVFEAYDDYNGQLREGVEEPEFRSDSITNSSGVTEWR